MSKTKVHTIPLNIGDLISGTFYMDATQFGAYMRLIIAHYQTGEIGLPYVEKQLVEIAKVSTTVWRNQIREVVLEKFEVVNDPRGKETKRLVHHKCLEEIKKIATKSRQNSENAKKRWKT